MLGSRFLLVLSLLLAPFAFAARQRAALPPLGAIAEGLLASPPIAVSKPVLIPTFSAQHTPRIAGGASQALLVWSGNKSARISAAGDVLDAEPRQLPFDGLVADAAWDGARYVAAGSRAMTTSVMAVSTTGALTLLADAPQSGPMYAESVAVLGDEIAVARQLGNSLSSVDLLLFAADGTLRRRVEVGTSPSEQRALRVVAGDDRYLVLSFDGAAIVTRDGRVTHIDLRASDAAWTGDGWTAIGGGASLALTRVAPNGALSAPVVVRSSEFGSLVPAIAWNGAEYRVVWKERKSEEESYSYPSYDTMLARLDASGLLLDEQVLAEKTDATGRFAVGLDSDDVVSVGGDFLAAWTRNLAPSIETRDLYVAASRAGEPAETARPQLVTRRLSSQTPAALAVRPGAARAVWSEERGPLPPAHLWSADVRRDGAAAAESDLGANVSFALAAWNGVDTLVVWPDGKGQIVGRRFADDGSSPDAQAFTLVAQAGDAPTALACGEGDCAVVWNGHLTRVAPSGAVLDAAPIDLPTPFLGIAARGADYLVLWRVFSYIYAAVLHDGVLGEPRLIADFGPLAIASNGSEWLLAVMHGVSAHTVRIGVNGEVAGWEDFGVSVASIDSPRLAWNGRHWFLAWSAGTDIRGARLDRDGKLIDEFPVATADYGALAGVGGAGDGAVAVLYKRSGRAYIEWLTDSR